MNFLIDTNVIIPLEPLAAVDCCEMTPHVTKLVQLAQKTEVKIFAHPITKLDIEKDKNSERKHLRLQLIKKYMFLPAPPSIDLILAHNLEIPLEGTNSWIDAHLIAAVLGDSCDFLISEDRGIHSKARRAGIGSRVLFIQDAIDLLATLTGQVLELPPSVSEVYLHQIDISDSLFDSLRADYDKFDDWYARSARQHRKAFIVTCQESKKLAAIAILKQESFTPDGSEGKILKLCTFKVSSDFIGRKYGELLLRAVMQYAQANEFTAMYFTAFPKQTELFDFAENFGFQKSDSLINGGEYNCIKTLQYTLKDEELVTPYQFAVRYAPGVLTFKNNSTYLVPVQPSYYSRLWPETEPQLSLFNTDPCGNSIRKAYLCHSPIRCLKPGDNLVFYRTRQRQGVYAIGTVDQTMVSKDVNQIVRKVSTRTVYSLEQIEKMCYKEILVVLFRHSITFEVCITAQQLSEHLCMKRAPQSIMKVPKKGIEWLKQRIVGL